MRFALIAALMAAMLAPALGQQISPENRKAADRLIEEGRDLIGRERLGEAMERLRSARKLNPFDVRAPFSMAEVELTSGVRGGDPSWLGRAREYLEEAARVNPEFGGIYFLHGAIGRQIGDFEAAVNGFAQSLDRGFRITDSRVGLAQALLGRGAEIALDLRVDADYAIHLLRDARDRLAALREDPRFDDATLRAFRRQWIEAQTHLAAASQRAERYDAAESILRDLMGLEPKSVQHPFNLGKLYGTREMWDKALDLYGKAMALSTDPTWVEPLPMIATIHSLRGEREAAEKQFAEYLSKHPDDWTALSRLAEHFVRVKDLPRAIEAFEKCVEAQPTLTSAMGRLAELHAEAGNEVDARKWRELRDTIEKMESER